MTATGHRATLELLSECNNACVFCAQAGLAPRTLDGDALAARLAETRTHADELTLVGGEPTLHTDLPGVIAAARSAGFRRVGLQTHARRLADPVYTRALARAGLTDVHASVHGPAPVHDYHTGVPGSFGESVAGISAAVSAGLTVVVATVLTRSNFRSLAELPRALVGRGASAWLLAVPQTAGRARAGFDRVVPRLALALPFALHAVQTARALSLPVWLSGAPLCLLGPFAAHALPGSPAGPRAYGAACAACTARDACPGLDPAYLTRFMAGEISPRAPLPTSAYVGDRAPVLARMFVGAGALTPGDTPGALAGAPPVRSRVALPMAGGG